MKLKTNIDIDRQKFCERSLGEADNFKAGCHIEGHWLLFVVIVHHISIGTMETRAPREGGNISILVLGDGTCPSQASIPYVSLRLDWGMHWYYCSRLYYDFDI